MGQQPSSAKAGFTLHACRAGCHRISKSEHAVEVVKRRVNHGHRISNVMSATYHIVIAQRNLYLYRKVSNVLHTSSRSTSWLPDWAADVWSNNSYLNHTSSLRTSWLPDWAVGVWSNNSYPNHTLSLRTSWLPDWAADVWSNNSYLNHTSSLRTSWLPDWAVGVWSNNSYLNHTSSLRTSWLPDWAVGVRLNNSLLKTRTDHTSPEPTHWRERPESRWIHQMKPVVKHFRPQQRFHVIAHVLSSRIVSSGGNPLPKS